MIKGAARGNSSRAVGGTSKSGLFASSSHDHEGRRWWVRREPETWLVEQDEADRPVEYAVFDALFESACRRWARWRIMRRGGWSALEYSRIIDEERTAARAVIDERDRAAAARIGRARAAAVAAGATSGGDHGGHV